MMSAHVETWEIHTGRRWRNWYAFNLLTGVGLHVNFYWCRTFQIWLPRDPRQGWNCHPAHYHDDMLCTGDHEKKLHSK